MSHFVIDYTKHALSQDSDSVSFASVDPDLRGASETKYNGSAEAEGIAEALLATVGDWREYHLSNFGSLHLHDILTVRKNAHTRHYMVSLFDTAIVCIGEDIKQSRAPPLGMNEEADLKLKLKGRLFLRDIQGVMDTSSADEFSFTINMTENLGGNTTLESCALIFKERTTLERWERSIRTLLLID